MGARASKLDAGVDSPETALQQQFEEERLARMTELKAFMFLAMILGFAKFMRLVVQQQIEEERFDHMAELKNFMFVAMAFGFTKLVRGFRLSMFTKNLTPN